MESTETTLPPLKMPRQSEVVARLCTVLAFIRREGIAETDVRLQVFHSDSSAGDAWELHSGDAQYDTDHRGYWGASGIGANIEPASLWLVARELLNQAAEQAAENGRTLAREEGRNYLVREGKGWRVILSDNGGADFDRYNAQGAVGKRAAVLAWFAQTFGGVPERSPVELRNMREQRRRAKESRRIEAMRKARNEWHALATEEESEELAHDILRAGYFGHVGRLADTVAERVREVKADGGDVDEAATEALHETCDGSAMVIYTAENFDVLRYSGNHDAYTEEMGDVPTNGDGSLNWAALAFSALAQDVRERFEREHGEALRSSDDAEGDE